MLDGVDDIYKRFFSAHSLSELGSTTSQKWLALMSGYSGEVTDFLEREWNDMIGRLESERGSHAAAAAAAAAAARQIDSLRQAKARLRWIFDVTATGKHYLNMPLPTKTFLAHLDEVMTRISPGVQAVSAMPFRP